MRSDSKSGYVYQFDVYTGKGDGGDSSTGLGSKVVLKLCQSLIGTGQHVAFDNFFASFDLLESLYCFNIYATATVRANRKDLPLVAREKMNLQKGEFEWRSKDHTYYVRWKDTKDVHALSTAFDHSISSVRRTQKDGNARDIPCPQIILQYGKRMGGVDRFDERRGRYSVSRRSRRWWMRIFYFLVDTSIVNAHILYNSVHPEKPLSLLQFRTMPFRELVGTFSSRDRQPPGVYVQRRHKALPKKLPGVPDDLRLLNVGKHMPDKQSVFRRCRVCSTRKNNKRSRIVCSVCRVPLCVSPCFAIFHKE